MNLRQVGYFGEQIAVNILEKHNFTIVERNVTYRGGELDIVARKNNRWCFIEVKWRRNQSFGGVEHALTNKKIYYLKKAVEYYVWKNKINTPYFIFFLLLQKQGGLIQARMLPLEA